jgi:hypothetical protein
MESMSSDDAIQTKSLQEMKGRDWCISPMTLIEILQTSCPEKRDKIIHFSQRLFNRELLASPEEIIINYINNGFPKEEPRYRLKSNSAFGNIWRDVVDNPEKQIFIDIDELKAKAKAIKSFSKNLHKIINNDDVIILPNNENEHLEYSLESMLNELTFIKEDEPYSAQQRKCYKIAIYYLMVLVCCQAGPSPECSNVLWEKLGIHCTAGRITYALKNWETLIYRGPLVLMAQMAFCQAQVDFSRGVYYDSLHAFYITYSDMFFTNDKHFGLLREKLANTPLHYKIHIMSEVELLKEENTGDFKAGMIIT